MDLGLILALRTCFPLPSPQSTRYVSLPNVRAMHDTFLRRLGAPEDVPSHVTDMFGVPAAAGGLTDITAGVGTEGALADAVLDTAAAGAAVVGPCAAAGAAAVSPCAAAGGDAAVGARAAAAGAAAVGACAAAVGAATVAVGACAAAGATGAAAVGACETAAGAGCAAAVCACAAGAAVGACAAAFSSCNIARAAVKASWLSLSSSLNAGLSRSGSNGAIICSYIFVLLR